MKWAVAALILASLGAAIASDVTATPPPGTGDIDPTCVCRKDVKCYTSLSDCENQTGAKTLSVGGNAFDCLGLDPARQFFACWEHPDVCRTVDSCKVPVNKKCQCRKDIKCYKTLNDCENQKNVITPHITDSNVDCENLTPPRPFFACWEEPDVCRSTKTCKVVPHGGGQQDPHFKGFDGSEYYFDGEPGYIYNIITDRDINVNAQFIRLETLKGTYMGRIGVRFVGGALTFDPVFGLFFNGSLLTSASIELPEASFSIEKSVSDHFRFTFQNDIWMLVATVAFEHGDRGATYVNLAASLLGDAVDPHGILGQTARFSLVPGAVPDPDNGDLVGVEGDYIVRDGIVGVNFPVNRFLASREAPEPITVSGTRVRREAKPRFEANSS